MNERPLYRTIANSIEARITNGGYAPDEPLPPEPVLAKEFGVSRITIRKALAQLKQKGLLYSRSGKGTIVRTDALVSQSMKITGSIAELSYYAKSTLYTARQCLQVSADQRLADRLAIPVGDHVLYMTGIRRDPEGPPFAFEEIYVPRPFSVGIDNSDLAGRAVFGMIETLHGISVAEVRQIVTAVMPDKNVRDALGLTNRQCCLRAVRLYLTQDRRAVQLAVVHYDSTRFEHTTVLYAS